VTASWRSEPLYLGVHRLIQVPDTLMTAVGVSITAWRHWLAGAPQRRRMARHAAEW
jgi:hypothetical protein